MTKQEIAVKVVLGKHIIDDMLKEIFWSSLINGRIERFMKAVEKCIEKLPLNKIPKTDREASDLLFEWTIPIRSAVAQEFEEDLENTLNKRKS